METLSLGCLATKPVKGFYTGKTVTWQLHNCKFRDKFKKLAYCGVSFNCNHVKRQSHEVAISLSIQNTTVSIKCYRSIK